MQQLRVCDAVEAIAKRLNRDVGLVVEALDLQQVKRLLDIAYAGITEPAHPTVIAAASSFCAAGLRSHTKLAKQDRERCLGAMVEAFTTHHGVTLSPNRSKLNEIFAKVRDGHLGAGELARWLATQVSSGDPSARLTIALPARPLQDCCVTLSHHVTDAVAGAAARDDFLVTRLRDGLTAQGAQVLAPMRRAANDGEPWRSDAVVRSQVLERFKKSNILIGLGDGGSGGVGHEIKSAVDLGMTVIFVKEGRTPSPAFDPAHVITVGYGPRIVEAAAITTRLLVEQPWRWMSSARRRDDRELLWLRERSRLVGAWNKRSSSQQRATAQVLHTSEERINLTLSSGAGLEMLGSGDLRSLYATLEVPAPGPLQANPQLRTGELESLARVVADRKLDVVSAFLAASDVQFELAGAASHRGELDDEEWHRYFDMLGLGRRGGASA